jgi:N utilization substance protein A
MSKILDIIDSIAYEKGLKISDVEEALKEALVNTAKRLIDENSNFSATIDKDNKELKLFQKIEVVTNDDSKLEGIDKKGNIVNKENYISIDEAKEIDPDVEIGDFLEYDIEFEDLGRNAATLLFNNLEYKLQRFIEQNLFKKYNAKIGTIITSVATYIDNQDNTFMEIGEVKAILPRKNRIKGEFFKRGDVIKAIVKNVKVDKQYGLIVEVSRTTPKFLEALLELEVPEMKDNRIVVESCARIPGVRAKVAVSTTEPNIDPIGAIVGVKGVRINAVSKELNGENIDCIDYSPIPEIFINRALAPAKIVSVKVIQKATEQQMGKAIVKVIESEKAKTIGKAGLNIRLASMLTRYELDIEVVNDDKESLFNNNQLLSEEEKTNSKDISKLEALFK